MSELTFGCDPELFLRNKKTGEFVSAHGVIPGSKKEPFKVNKGAVQVDGMAVEFNIDPVKTGEEFAFSVKAVLEQLSEMVGPDLELVAKPTVHFSDEVFAAQPPEALELGCEPDYNAYTGEQNTPPNGAAKFRTGAGHIHIGWCEDVAVDDPEHVQVCRIVVQQLDYYLGVVSHQWDDDKDRRQLYGAKGAYRVKPYGVEYRPLSNAWLNLPEIYSKIPELVQRAWDRLMERYPKVDEVEFTSTVFDGTQRIRSNSGLWDIPHYIGSCTKPYNYGKEMEGTPSIESLLGLPKGEPIHMGDVVHEMRFGGKAPNVPKALWIHGQWDFGKETPSPSEPMKVRKLRMAPPPEWLPGDDVPVPVAVPARGREREMAARLAQAAGFAGHVGEVEGDN